LGDGVSENFSAGLAILKLSVTLVKQYEEYSKWVLDHMKNITAKIYNDKSNVYSSDKITGFHLSFSA